MRQALLALAFLMPVLGVNAQDVATLPAFEVASIKPNKSGQRNSTANQVNGRFTATNNTLLHLITWAYGLHTFQVVGAPAWAGSERFDIEAKSEDGAETAARLSLMLRSLLNERFTMKAHTETRELPILALVVARSDRRLGPQITPSAVDCVALIDARNRGIPEPTPSAGARRACAMSMAAGNIVAGSMLIADLAFRLSIAVQGIVEDRTGLSGRFDFDLRYAAQVTDRGAVMNAPAVSGDSDKPSLFSAVQEQLGLKLESTRGPVEVLVIDSVERPTPD